MTCAAIVAALVVLCCACMPSAALNPSPTTTAALGRPIISTSTCGSPADTYCYSEASQCFTCNATCPFPSADALQSPIEGLLPQPECGCPASYPVPVDLDSCCETAAAQSCVRRINTEAHPPQFAVDADEGTYFQSEQNAARVNVTLDLLLPYEVTTITVTFSERVPYAFAILKSNDAQTWEPFQFFTRDCEEFYGIAPDQQLTEPDQVICDTTKTSVRNDEISLRTLTAARIQLAGGSYAASDVLHDFVHTRFIRVAFAQYYDETTAVDDFGVPLDHEPFYTVTNIQVEGRCGCHGHAASCSVDVDSAACACEHNTGGPACGECLPLFNAKPFARGISDDEPNVCVACDCNEHALSCHYNASLDAFPNDRTRGDGGVCDSCMHNTAGIHCETCAPGYYENPAVPRNHVNACIPCECNAAGSESSTCNPKTGACECKANVMGDLCDMCKPSFYDLSLAHDEGCESCDCVVFGTIEGSRDCDATTGQCECLPSNTGQRCSECSVGHFHLAGTEDGVCIGCHPQCSDTAGCNGPGASLAACNGQCRNVEEDGVCVDACSDGRYANEQGVCRLCHPQCLDTCTAGTASTASCSQCRNFEENGLCVAECSANTYADDNLVCQQCHDECIGCTGPTPAQCKQCRHVRSNGVCVAECPEGTYADGSGVCQPCSSECVAEFGCTGPDATQCFRCDGVYDVSRDAVPYVCLSTCPPLYHATRMTLLTEQPNAEVVVVEDAAVCQPCSTQCEFGCDGPTTSDCVGGCVAASYNGRCVPACPTHTYRDGELCIDCHPNCNHTQGCYGPGRDQCFDCRQEGVSLNGDCLSACPTGYFADEDRVCQPCSPFCSTCFGSSAAECFRCKSHRLGVKCVGECPSATTYITAVPGGALTTTASPVTDFGSSGDASVAPPRPPRNHTTAPIAPYECFACHPQCGLNGCAGPTAYDCDECESVKYDGECISTCPPLTYRDGNVCKDCSEECADGCFSSGADSCFACRGFEVEGVCVGACPETYVMMNDTCLPCHRFCSLDEPGCSGVGPDACNACAPTRFLHVATQTCVAACPSNTFATRDRECLPCDEECSGGCLDAGADNCRECLNVKLADTCVAECPDGFYADVDGECQRCDPMCASLCTGPGPSRCARGANDTSACKHFTRGATCVAACDALTEYADDANVCQKCSPLCADGCVGPTAADCGACASAELDGTCVDTCPLTHYRDEAGLCRRCNAECASVNGTRACTGPGADACLACAHVKRGRECVRSCLTREVAVDGVCRGCHAQCSSDGCFGLEATECLTCRNFEFGGECVAACDADTTYTSTATAECLPCHRECSLRAGSGGCPAGTSADDCVVCAHVRDNGRCEAECSTGTYADEADTETALGGVCKACHPSCDPLRGCTGGRADECNECAHVSYQGVCRTACPDLTYLGSGSECLDCDANCLLGCTGPGADQCVRSSNVLDSSAEALGCRTFVDILANGVVMCVAECPITKYADSNGVCRACSTLCPLEYGCTGPTLADCNSCPATQYLAPDRTCADCSASCSTDLDLAGCTGPEPKQCNVCAGARYSGGCVDDCSALTDVDVGLYFGVDDTSVPDEVQCVPCHEQCVAGGCTGAGPDQCLFGCKNFAQVDGATGDVTCVETCGANTFVADTPVPRTCVPCHSRCRGGCRDETPFTCVECARFRTEEGECVDVCPPGWVPGTDGVCRCPTDRSYTNTTSGQCLPCSVLCSAGCTGPLPSQCKGGSDGCTFAEHNGVCVADCPTGMVRQNSVCVCKFNHITVTDPADGCMPCDDQCADGCTGPTASDCLRCRNYRSGEVCVEECAADEQPDADRFCAPCHPECAGGCIAPGDALQCVSCRAYKDAGECVSNCPSERFFVTQSGVCVEECPSDTPFYNDTRPLGEADPAAPQLCVDACAALGALRNLVNKDVPQRCSTQAQLDVDFASASGSSATKLTQTSLTVIVAAGVLVLVIVVAVVLVLRRRRRESSAAFATPGGKVTALNPGAKVSPTRTKLNALYEPSPRRPGHHSGGGGGGDVSFDGGPRYDVANISGTDSSMYMDPMSLNDTADHMDGYLEVRPQNPYSMSDQALFEPPINSAVQSTRM
ncbi:laminin alpha 5 chain [Salpingoeca rosetta]|uniref:Laminin alpha 5 chain n=1 Tax=Salpingoeca rosetta (strain ATCC 50818 / BSB-021) TaxID=946362 RepID=F2UAN3_SALR5|nr:laminin alpha 5 chain [Salpingoeca rosetta]EGD73449.1 laminin alpha 5 chain [Salpingoeca rosetta]|eukprot:XP_004993731.1 laminin alpha 5 chain [Salpingoeca rosetta]